ncbi:MAG: Tex family protein [Bacteroidales bacterium]|nr:Tex family protein [Bacteroidales bacterium]
MKIDFVDIISKELGLSKVQVNNTLKLLEGGATVPFLARYRKEVTGSLDEVQITHIRNRNDQLKELEKRREAILSSIKEQEKMTPELEEKINSCTTISELEDVYLPFKPKKKTRATEAKAKGLEPLAIKIMQQELFSIEQEAKKYVDASKNVTTIEDALSGARDIIAEWINEDSNIRGKIRYLFSKEAAISSHVAKGKQAEARKYEDYFDYTESFQKAPSHRIMAMLRGEREGFLKISIEPNESEAMSLIFKIVLRAYNDAAQQVKIAAEDCYKRLLCPSMVNEFRQIAKERADIKAVEFFADNLRQLLLAPPLGEKNVLAIDPGFRTGCKVVCLDKQGNLLHNETIYPHPPEVKVKEAVKKIQYLVSAYKIEAIAIGNGTASRETERFIKSIRFEKDIIAVMVNESGASIYSASALAREEFPDYDITVRGAVSIGRRLMDPLAELVKIDPKSIGVGQYQHDVDQNLLQKNLEDVVVSCVNQVGVELNTASKELLTYVSGVGPVLAQNIVSYRKENGPFTSRKDLKKVKRLGEKVFEQAAGFLRLRNGKNPLDNCAIHPESYPIVEKMASSIGCKTEELLKNEEARKRIDIKNFVTTDIGIPTLEDIMKELAKPGLDPRKKFDVFEFSNEVHSMKDLKIGMKLPGIITNITAFGAFVDIGVHQDGLVHISQMADKFIQNPNDVVKLNQKVMVKVLEIDTERKRISLSMKSD